MTLRLLITRLLLALIFCSFPLVGAAKGGGVSFWMEGTVADVRVSGDHIHFKLIGRFWMDQYSDASPSPQQIAIDCKGGVAITLHQNDPFFAFTSDWSGGSIQKPGGLARIVSAAEKHERKVRFELLQPEIVFDSKQKITLTDAAVIRATDADLR